MESGCSAEFAARCASTLIVYGGSSCSGTRLPNLGHNASGLRNALSLSNQLPVHSDAKRYLCSRLELLGAREHREGGFWIGMR